MSDPKKERQAKNSRNTRARCKSQVLHEYGGVCDLCGEDDPDILTMDHLWGDGGGRNRGRGNQNWTTLRQKGFPHGFRVLCFNCNIKSYLTHTRTGTPLMTVRTIQNEIKRWADRVYSNRTESSILEKLKEENQELIDALASTENIEATELADVLILVLDLASIRGVDVYSAVIEKLEINRKRSWVINPDTGVMRHA